MTNYLSRDQYSAVQSRIIAGEATLAIARDVSRQFFLRVSNASVSAVADTSVVWPKTLIWSGYVASPALLIICVLLIIQTFSWWAVVLVPLAGIFWAILTGLTYDKGGWVWPTLGSFAVCLLPLFVETAYSLPVLSFTLSLWIHRMTFIMAQSLMTSLLGASYEAFDMLAEHITLDDTAAET